MPDSAPEPGTEAVRLPPACIDFNALHDALVAKPDDPAAAIEAATVIPDGSHVPEITTEHVGGGTMAILSDGEEVERVKGKEAAEARAAELGSGAPSDAADAAPAKPAKG